MFRRAYSDREAGFWRFYADVKVFACVSIDEARRRLAWLLSTFDAKRPAIVTDAGVAAADFFEALTRDLPATPVLVGADCDAEPMLRALASPQIRDADAVLAIGGGSVLDAAKIIAACAASGLDPETLLARESPPAPPLPLLAAPTTFGTGSEANMIAHLKTGARKLSVRRDWLTPAAALLIGEIATVTPATRRYLAAVDAWVHAFEALTLRREVSPIQQALCRQALALHERGWDEWLESPSAEAGLAMASAACMAGLAINNARTGLIHALAAPFAERMGLAHAPSLLPFIEPAIAHNWSGLKPHFPRETLASFLDRMEQTVLRRRREVLAEQRVAATDEDIEAMIGQCRRDTVLFKENPAPLSIGDLDGLYRRGLREFMPKTA